MEKRLKRWEIIYEIIEDFEVNDVLSYAAIEHALNLPIETGRIYVYRAIRELEEQKHRTMENQRNVGYRVVAANEHERLARRDIKLMRRKAAQAQSKTVNVRREELTRLERSSLDALNLKLRTHTELAQRLFARRNLQGELPEPLISSEFSDRLEKLEKQIAAFESKLSDS